MAHISALFSVECAERFHRAESMDFNVFSLLSIIAAFIKPVTVPTSRSMSLLVPSARHERFRSTLAVTWTSQIRGNQRNKSKIQMNYLPQLVAGTLQLNDQSSHEFPVRAEQCFVSAVAESEIGERHARVSTQQNAVRFVDGGSVFHVFHLRNKRFSFVH